MKPRKPAHAPAVDRALDIIELLAASERYLALSEIVKRTGIPILSFARLPGLSCRD